MILYVVPAHERFAVADAVSTHGPGEVCGWRGVVGDIAVDRGGGLLSMATDFTRLELRPGSVLHVGGLEARHAFEHNNGLAIVDSVEAHRLTLKWPSGPSGIAESGAGKEIDIYISHPMTSRPMTDAEMRSFFEAP